MRRFATATVALALRGAPLEKSYSDLCKSKTSHFSQAVDKGTMRGDSYRVGRKRFFYLSAENFQEWLERTNQARLPEWMCERLLGLSAETVLRQGGQSKGIQMKLDEEFVNGEG